ncbi:MAG: hypothetical protein AAGU75_11765 [Bacillota bacterium]
MEPLFFVFFLFLLPLVLGIIIPVYKNHYKSTGNIINYDSTMRKFVYKVYMSQEEIINTLKVKGDIDELSCTFDFERSIIQFSEYGSNREFYFTIQACDGFCIFRLNQVALIGMQSHIPYKLNPFIVSKLKAEIVPFAQFGI